MEYFEHLPNWMVVVITLIFASVWKQLRQLAKEIWIWFETKILNLIKKSAWESCRRLATLRPYARIELSNEQYSRLRVPGSNRSYDIDALFVPLRIQDQSHNSDTVLEIGNRLIIIGEPGAGKTSLVNKLYRDACKENKKWISKGQFPVVIRLKNVDIGDGTSIIETVRNDLKRKSVTELDVCFDASLLGKGVLILLDGLDEVASHKYSAMKDLIISLAKQLDSNPNNQLVLTMRTQFYRHVGDDFRHEFANIAELKRFENSDVFEFLSRWPFEKPAHEHVSRIHKQLVMKPSLREMCTNPLVLAMYVARDQKNRNEHAPTTRTEFYDTVVQELLYKRRAHQLDQVTGNHTIKNQREHILGILAFTHLMDEKSNRNDISHDLALELTQQVIQSDRDSAELFLMDLAKETGLISEGKRRASWMFIHLTFCEFFAASYAVHRCPSGWDILNKRNVALQGDPQHADRLAEVIPFACGLLPPKDRDGAINDLKTYGQHRIIFRCFFESKAYTHQAWTEYLNKMSKEFLETSIWTRDRLDDLLWFIIAVRDANHESQTANGIATLDLQSFMTKMTNLREIILTYSSSDPAATLQLISTCGMDLLQFPELITSNCYYEHFLTLLKPAIINDSRTGDWAKTLLSSCDSAKKTEFLAQQQLWIDWKKPVQQTSYTKLFRFRKRSSLLTQLIQNACFEEYKTVPTKILELAAIGTLNIALILSQLAILMCNLVLVIEALIRVVPGQTFLTYYKEIFPLMFEKNTFLFTLMPVFAFCLLVCLRLVNSARTFRNSSSMYAPNVAYLLFPFNLSLGIALGVKSLNDLSNNKIATSRQKKAPP